MNSRRRFYKLTAKSHSDAQRWVQSILDVIDSRPPIITPTEKLIDDIKVKEFNYKSIIIIMELFRRMPSRMRSMPFIGSIPYFATRVTSSNRLYFRFPMETFSLRVFDIK